MDVSLVLRVSVSTSSVINWVLGLMSLMNWMKKKRREERKRSLRTRNVASRLLVERKMLRRLRNVF